MADKPVRRILIEGWRNLAHSYAVVNQFHCLELLRRPDVQLFHYDARHHDVRWRKVKGLFSANDERALAALGALPPGTKADVIFRISFPYDLSAAPASRLLVFGTAENGFVPDSYVAGRCSLAEAHAQNPQAILCTPSEWSRRGFIRSGADARRLAVLPHGVDPEIYFPLADDLRQALRRELKWSGFVFLHIGDMSGNKGLHWLLQAFAVVAQKHPESRLILKGSDALYPSSKLLSNARGELTQAQASLIEPRVYYYGETLCFADMARLYQAADAYVSPYTAEGFNLPVLEAVACGLPVICTAGGSTDDFLRDDFALRIASTEQTDPALPGAHWLQPDPDALLAQMLAAIEQPELSRRARQSGPDFVRGGYTWKHAVTKLLEIMFPNDGAPS